MSNHFRRDCTLIVGDGFVHALNMGANLRLSDTHGWSVWARVLDNIIIWSPAVVDDFGNLQAVKS